MLQIQIALQVPSSPRSALVFGDRHVALADKHVGVPEYDSEQIRLLLSRNIEGSLELQLELDRPFSHTCRHPLELELIRVRVGACDHVNLDHRKFFPIHINCAFSDHFQVGNDLHVLVELDLHLPSLLNEFKPWHRRLDYKILSRILHQFFFSFKRGDPVKNFRLNSVTGRSTSLLSSVIFLRVFLLFLVRFLIAVAVSSRIRILFINFFVLYDLIFLFRRSLSEDYRKTNRLYDLLKNRFEEEGLLNLVRHGLLPSRVNPNSPVTRLKSEPSWLRALIRCELVLHAFFGQSSASRRRLVSWKRDYLGRLWFENL